MKMNMKKLVLSDLAPLLLAGCYKDYTLDYDYTAAYIAYQYDLRTFVIVASVKRNCMNISMVYLIIKLLNICSMDNVQNNR